MRPLVVLLGLLIILCLIVPDVCAVQQTTKSSRKQTSKSDSDISNDESITQSTTAESQRLARKQQRINQSINRVNQWEKRITDQSKKLASRYQKSAQARGEKNRAKALKTKRLTEKSASYWTMKRESIKPDNIKKATATLSYMRKLAESAVDSADKQSKNQTTSASSKPKSSILALKSRDVGKTITTAPRPYWTLLALTALDPKYKCEICQRAHQTMLTVANLAHRHNLEVFGRVDDAGSNPSLSLSTPLLSFNSSVNLVDREVAQRAADEKLKGDLPVFVVELDIDSNRELFNSLQLSTAPLIVLLPPIISNRKIAPSQLLDGLPGKYKFMPQSLDIPVQSFIDFINQAVNHKIGSNTDSGDASFTLTEQLVNRATSFINGLRSTWKQTDQVIQSYAITIVTMFAIFAVHQLYRFMTSKEDNAGLIGFLFPPINAHVIKETVIVEHLHLQTKDQHIDRDITRRTQEEVPVVHNMFPVPSASRLRRLPLAMYPLVLAAMTFYFFCVSGGIFTLIKGSERGYRSFENIWTKGGATVSQQYMDQTVAESALVASMYASMALLFALISLISFGRAPITVTDNEPRPAKTWATSLRQFAVFILGSLLALSVAFLIFFMYCQIVNVYGKKTNYQFGTNWKFLQKIDWNKLIPYPAFHRYVRIFWSMVKSKLL